MLILRRFIRFVEEDVKNTVTSKGSQSKRSCLIHRYAFGSSPAQRKRNLEV